MTSEFLQSKVTDEMRTVLARVADGLESGRWPWGDDLKTYVSEPTHFNMIEWTCGTVACIGGLCQSLAPGMDWLEARELHPLFFPATDDHEWPDEVRYADIEPRHAARAVRSWLATGRPCWREALDVE